MIKKIAAALTLIIILLSTVAMAAPEYVTQGDYGNSSGLITITRPDKDKDFSYDQGYYFSGIGKSGVSVTLYRYDANAGVYKKINRNGNEATMFVGASGLFWTTIGLNYGDNFLLARAQDSDGTYQISPFLLTYRSSNLMVNFGWK